MTLRALSLRLEGPMQSWGGPVAGNDRPTRDEPTKSGVLGLVAGALGHGRDELEALARLHEQFALVVRVDRRGRPGRDFHTAEGVPTVEGKVRGAPVVSRRGYLYDASFAALLVERSRPPGAPTPERVLEALRLPRYAPYLGRKACPPSRPVWDAARVLEGADVFALLRQVPEAEPLPGGRRAARGEVHVEASLCPGAHAPSYRVRDALRPPLPRLFFERAVLRFSFTDDMAPPRPGPPAPGDTIDRFFGAEGP
ncbi:MAG TPA: type I-E CRISPR-associated protein Cas5/CasD [Polyangiaceae bacterium]|nr:type I-E CRISPR-associated protein Cas5/CasD [Polyangiaceae bacterium]